MRTGALIRAKIKCGYFYLILILSLGACARNVELNNEIKITNGQLVEQDKFPAIRLIVNNLACTGFFISKSVLLTAAHCADGAFNNPPMPAYLKNDQGEIIFAKYVIRPSDVKGYIKETDDFSQLTNQYKNDFAKFIFEEGQGLDIDPIHYLRLSAQSNKIGDPVTLVGFGRYNRELKSDFKLRMGTNVIAEISDDYIKISGYSTEADEWELGKKVGGGSGDSGSPLINAAGEAIGLFSFDWRFMGQLFKHDSYYLNLTSKSVQHFISSANNCEDLDSNELACVAF